MRRAQFVLVCLVALAVTGGAVALLTLSRGTHAGQASSIQAASFDAALPAGWVVVQDRSNAKGARGLHLSSTGAPIDGLGIGPDGTAAITIAESAPNLLDKATIGGRPASSISPAKMLPLVIGQPAQAVSVVTNEKPTSISLDGAPAAEAAFGYGFEGRSMMQVDVIAEHGGRLFTVELDAEPALARQSTAAWLQVLSSWRWR
jgi:hypothetical protein